MPVRHTFAALGTMAVAFSASPALAQEGYYDEDGYYWEDSAAEELPPPPADLPPVPAGPRLGYSAEQRDAWLADCRERMRPHDDGLGGALIGGVIGGVAGNRIAGRGNRTVGTVIGAGVGAVAGAAIDRAEDGGRVRDYCEDYLARYEASLGGGYGAGYGVGHGFPGGPHGYGMAGGYGYAGAGFMWVPVVISGGCRKSCGCGQKEVVVDEWVDEPAPPPARRVVPRRDKRVKIQRYVK
jgi:hypothetical protein